MLGILTLATLAFWIVYAANVRGLRSQILGIAKLRGLLFVPAALAVNLFACSAAAVIDPPKSSEPTAQVQVQPGAAAATPAPAATVRATATPRPAPTATPAPVIGKTGETLATKNWRVTLAGVERPGKSLVWSSFGNKQEAVGTWLVINVDLENTGKENFTVNDWDFELKTADGVTYKGANCCFLYADLKKMQKLGQQLPPGVPAKSALIYDIAPAAAGMTLTFKQDGGRTWAIE
ncbi:MAG: DUF4352 domain-containing protein [Chloroflexi bacterium]|nr:DUF4352 domain-containing protein [Chloroflexota bacterium]